MPIAESAPSAGARKPAKVFWFFGFWLFFPGKNGLQ
jgi:hypothetical protein